MERKWRRQGKKGNTVPLAENFLPELYLSLSGASLQFQSEIREWQRMSARSILNSIGFLLQFSALVFLPLLIIWQLNFGFQLLWMPGLTLVGLAAFWIGHALRDKESGGA